MPEAENSHHLSISAKAGVTVVHQFSQCTVMQTSLKWLTVAMPIIERPERDQGETRKRLEREKRGLLID